MASAVGPILQDIALAARRHNIHAYVGRMSGEENNMADSTSRLTHLPNWKFLSHFHIHLPQRKLWNILPLPSACRQKLTKMTQIKRYPRASIPPLSINTPPPGANGSVSAAGCKLPQTLKSLNTPFRSSKFPPSVSVPDFCPRKRSPSRSNWSGNTSATSVKSLHTRGPTNPATTTWESLTFGLDASWRPVRKKILLQQECVPYRLMSYNLWTPPPKEPPQEISPPENSTGSTSSSSSGWASTERAAPIPSSARSDSGTSNSSLESRPTTPRWPPMTSLHKQNSSVSSSRLRITDSRES